jgi:hypothetical protein
MKKIGWIIVALVSFASSQVKAADDDVFSFYFDKQSLFSLNSVPQVLPQLWGKYELRDLSGNEMRRASGDNLYVDKSGIYLKKNKLITISREEVRENSKYQVKDNYIHGVIENDSLPVALEKELYYFLVPAKTYLFENKGGANRMMQISKTRYAIFTFEDVGYYSVLVAEFTTEGVSLKDLALSTEGPKSLDLVQKKEVSEELSKNYKTYILTPDKDEWSQLLAKCTETYDSYTRVRE